MSNKGDFHGRWVKSSIGVTLYISGTVYVQVFNIHELGWRWKLNGIPSAAKYEGGAATMKQAKIDAVGALAEAFELLVERVKLAQQNTPGFSPPEKQK